MDRALDAGINLFDTANAYGGGRSEAYIGRWLKAKGSAAREQLLLSSKVFNPVGPGPNDRGLSRRHILQQVDASLTRLQTDRLDMYLDPRARSRDAARRDDAGAGRSGAGGKGAVRRREQHRGVAAGALAVDQRHTQAGALRMGAELLQPARSRAGARAVSAVRRSGRGVHRVQPAGRRMVDRQVPERPAVSGGIAHDAAAGAVPAPGPATRCFAGSDGVRGRQRAPAASR